MNDTLQLYVFMHCDSGTVLSLLHHHVFMHCDSGTVLSLLHICDAVGCAALTPPACAGGTTSQLKARPSER
jgi:hypothetical protein